MPSRVYFDLSTWHLINTVYQPARVAGTQEHGGLLRQPVHHTRLMRVIHDRLGHNLISRAEQAKIDVATTGLASLDLHLVERGIASRPETGRRPPPWRPTCNALSTAPAKPCNGLA